MKLADAIQLLIGVVIMGLLFVLVQNAVDTSRAVGRLETDSTGISQRVDRIAAALPGIGIQVAQEQLDLPSSVLILASDPAPSDNPLLPGELTYTVVDLRSGLGTVYTMPLSQPEQLKTVGATAYVADKIDPNSASLSEMQSFARIAGKRPLTGGGVDYQASFVLRGPSSLEFLEAAPWITGEKRPITVSASGSTYDDLLRAFDEASSKARD